MNDENRGREPYENSFGQYARGVALGLAVLLGPALLRAGASSMNVGIDFSKYPLVGGVPVTGQFQVLNPVGGQPETIGGSAGTSGDTTSVFYSVDGSTSEVLLSTASLASFKGTEALRLYYNPSAVQPIGALVFGTSDNIASGASVELTTSAAGMFAPGGSNSLGLQNGPSGADVVQLKDSGGSGLSMTYDGSANSTVTLKSGHGGVTIQANNSGSIVLSNGFGYNSIPLTIPANVAISSGVALCINASGRLSTCGGPSAAACTCQ